MPPRTNKRRTAYPQKSVRAVSSLQLPCLSLERLAVVPLGGNQGPNLFGRDGGGQKYLEKMSRDLTW